jgi:hypothetical protein
VTKSGGVERFPLTESKMHTHTVARCLGEHRRAWVNLSRHRLLRLIGLSEAGAFSLNARQGGSRPHGSPATRPLRLTRRDCSAQCSVKKLKTQVMAPSKDIEQIVAHYEKAWGSNMQSRHWSSGPTWQLPPDFQILVFPPTQNPGMWKYATCGMSLQGDANPIELHLLSKIESDAHLELLTMAAHYHLTCDYLGLNHMVNIGHPWLPESQCDRGLLSLPYLYGPDLEWLEMAGRRVRFLWFLPITASEAQFKKDHGIDALEDRFEAGNFDYLDPLRKSVV